MEFWESFLVILGSVVAGLVISLAIIYVITRIQKKPFILFSRKENIEEENSLPDPDAMPSPVREQVVEQKETSMEELTENKETNESIEEPRQLTKSEIIKELETNLEIATTPWAGKLTLFQTTAWDNNNVKTESRLSDIQEEISQVYIDIRLANSIVWLSNEVGHRSADLDESYKQLCVKIAERIKRIVPSFERAK